MANPEEMIGRSMTLDLPYTVTREKIAEFVQALDDHNPAYQGANPIAPPTFASIMVTAAWNRMFADPTLDLQLKRMIHGDQEFTWTRPMRAGDQIVVTLQIENLKKRGKSEYLDVAIHMVTVEGEEVCVSRSLLIHNRGADEEA